MKAKLLLFICIGLAAVMAAAASDKSASATAGGQSSQLGDAKGDAPKRPDDRVHLSTEQTVPTPEMAIAPDFVPLKVQSLIRKSVIKPPVQRPASPRSINPRTTSQPGMGLYRRQRQFISFPLAMLTRKFIRGNCLSFMCKAILPLSEALAAQRHRLAGFQPRPSMGPQ